MSLCVCARACLFSTHNKTASPLQSHKIQSFADSTYSGCGNASLNFTSILYFSLCVYVRETNAFV